MHGYHDPHDLMNVISPDSLLCQSLLISFPSKMMTFSAEISVRALCQDLPVQLYWCFDANAIIVCLSTVTTALPPGSGHERRCNETEKGYCVNNGECYFIHGINQLSCK